MLVCFPPRTPSVPVQGVAISRHDQLYPKLLLYRLPTTPAFLPLDKQNRTAWSKAKKLRSKKGGDKRRQARRGSDDDDDSDEDDDEDREMEVATRHEELVYWYTGFEDPNCIAVVELVATVMDMANGIQARSFCAACFGDAALHSSAEN